VNLGDSQNSAFVILAGRKRGNNMDALEQIAGYATISAAVLAKGEECTLIALDEDGAPLNETLLDEARDKGMHFAGIFGIVNGVARCKSQSLEDVPTMLGAMPAFIEYVRERLTQRGDSESWLSKLYQLPDTRDELGRA